MHLYRPHLNAPLLIGVGAAFDFIAGVKDQAPVWMQKRGLEWLFRLFQEPSRLWKRYLVYNVRFILHIFNLYRRGQLR
jgi:N-acetylglucosaminyldiphosphoundecaprenol N-acetyl-beta-D-mannosaminyltransferase